MRIEYEDWLAGIEKNVVWSELTRQLLSDYFSIDQKHSPEIEELESKIAESKKIIEEHNKQLQKAVVQLSIKRLKQKEEHDRMMIELPAYKKSIEEAGLLNWDM